MSVRIFVGGLPPDVTKADLCQRFTSFGNVEDCQLAPAKIYTTLHANSKPEHFSRNFGYVTLVPKDEKSVSRAVGLYNGTLWRGTVLRCQVAKERIFDTLEKEKLEWAEGKHIAVSNNNNLHPTPEHAAKKSFNADTLRIRNPDTQEIVAVPLGGVPVRTEVLHSLSPAQIVAAEEAAWDPIIERPVRRTFEEHLRSLPAPPPKSAALDSDEEAQDKAPSSTTREIEFAPLVEEFAARPMHTRQNLKRSAQPFPVRPGSQRVRIVDFITEDDAADWPLKGVGGTASSVAAPADLSRFGSSDSEEDITAHNMEEHGSRDTARLVTGSGGNRVFRRRIPQVDGGGDSSSSQQESENDDSDGSSDATATTSSDSESDSGDSRGGSERADEDDISVKSSEGDGVNLEGNLNNKERQSTGSCDSIGCITDVLPSAASFFRREPQEQVEAAWRARREMAVKEFRDWRRQALRQAGSSNRK